MHAGQVVARLDPATYVAQLRVAEAAHAQTQAAFLRAQAEVLEFRTEVEDAQTKLTRAEELAAKQIIPPADLEAARLALDEAHADLGSGEAVVAQAEAAIVQAEAALEQAEINVEHTIIRSPIDGIVIDRDVDVGQTLAASMQSPVLFRIATDLTRLQVQVDIDESDVGGLTPGESVSFDVESYPDRDIPRNAVASPAAADRQRRRRHRRRPPPPRLLNRAPPPPSSATRPSFTSRIQMSGCGRE